MHFLKKRWPIMIAAGIIITFVFAWKNPFTQASPLSKEEIETQLVAMYDGDVENLTLRSNMYEAKLIKDGAEYAVQADAESGKVLSLEQTKEAPPEKPPIQNEETETEDEPPIEETEPPEEDEPTEEDEINSGEVVHEDKKSKETKETKENTEDKKAKETKENKDETKDKKIDEEQEEQEETDAEEEPTRLISKEEAANIALGALPEGMIGEVDQLEYIETNEGGYYLVEVDIDTEDDMDEVVYEIHAISGEILTTKWDD